MTVQYTRESDDEKSAIEQLIAVMAMLRHPTYGCPWDLEQDLNSLVAYTLEEVYEVVEAIESGDLIEIEEELGDLLFQVVFYAQIASEDKNFNFDSVAKTITEKLIRRHPHVFPGGLLENFGQKIEIDTEQVALNWEVIKKREKELKQQKKGHGPQNPQLPLAASVLDAVPLPMPALQRAEQLQRKAAQQGFDWQEITPVIAKLKEEIAELEQAIEIGSEEAIKDELGDVLFSAVNVARHASIDPESSLRSANNKFTRRFKWVESTLSAKNGSIRQATSEELDQLWTLAKNTGSKR